MFTASSKALGSIQRVAWLAGEVLFRDSVQSCNPEVKNAWSYTSSPRA